MKKIFALALTLLSALLLHAQSTTVVISQVYGGGGSASGTYQSDYVELHNISNTAQDISGSVLMYGSTSGNLGSSASNIFTFPTGTSIPAGGYLLVATIASTGLAPLPLSADFTFSFNMSGTNGKVALGTSAMLNNSTIAAQPAGAVIDFVGYGTANESEGTAVAALSATTAALRKNSGCTETNNNSTDFAVGTPTPRNATSTPFSCSGGTPVPVLTLGTLTSFGNQALATPSTAQTLNVSGSNLTGFPGQISISSSVADFEVSNNNTTWGATTSINFDSATLLSTPVYVRFNPQANGVRNGVITISGGGVSPAVTVNATGIGGTILPPSTGGIVISQVYGAGGNPGSIFNADYVELHNNTASVQSLNGYTIQYSSATQTASWSGRASLPAVNIPAGGYFLVQMSSTGTVGASLPTPDYVATPSISMSATNGRVGLVSDTSRLSGCPTTPNVIDIVGYGTSICFEGAAAVPALDSSRAAFRNNNGCDDTNNNQADFTTATPVPRNSASPVFLCNGSTPSPSITTGTLTSFGNQALSTPSTSQTLNISGSNLTGFPGQITISSSIIDFEVSSDNTTWGATTTISYTAASLSSTPIYVRFNPQVNGVRNGVITIGGGGVSSSVTVNATGIGGTPPPPSTSGIVISQVYGAGGNPGSVFNADYVELHNNTTSAQSLSGYTIQYSSSGQTGNWSGRASMPSVSIPAGGYFLVQMSSTGTVGATLPTPDYVATPSISMSATNGRVGLVSDTSRLSGCPTTPNVIDIVGYGTSICFEGSAAVPALDTLRAAFRNNNGCDDTNNNLADFTTATPVPRNSASPVYLCSAAPTPVLNATALQAFGNICVGNISLQTTVISGSNLTASSVSVGPLPGYTFSTNILGPFTDSVSIAVSGATLNDTILYVQFVPSAGTAYDGNIAVRSGSTTANLSASGTGLAPTQPLFSSIDPVCSGTNFTLPANSNNGVAGTWNPAVNNTTTTTYTFSPNAGACATTAQLTVVVNDPIVPTFDSIAPVCAGSSFTLPTTSNNGITGTWSPAVNNAVTTTYTFTPISGQCATTTTLSVVINPNLTPTFDNIAPICAGASFTLATTSNNGITGSWSPAVNPNATTTYTFTPATGQCAVTANQTVTVRPVTTTTFSQISAICRGGNFTLPTTSTNSIQGTWSPAVNNTITTTYTFTPSGDVCATPFNMTVEVIQPTFPVFNQQPAVCRGVSFTLPTTSTNGIIGTWSPAVNSNSTTTYTFTPTAGQCATTSTMTVSVNNPGVVALLPADTVVCSGASLSFSTTSLNNITGTWSPAYNPNATTTYTFTPDAGQCADGSTRTITVNPVTTTVFTQVSPVCSGASIVLPTTSNNGITGTWTPPVNNTATTTYLFTPTIGVCATSVEMTVVVNPIIDPTFDSIAPICTGTTFSLASTSNNGITGSWSPAVNNTSTTTYTFTPTAGLCANSRSITVVVNPIVTPQFDNIAPVCSGAIITLPTTSINGITGTWSPAINNTATTTYTFTPTAGQCAVSVTKTVEVVPVVTPAFTQVSPVCSGVSFDLPTTSTNSINGTWSPVVNNIATTTYTFTPAIGTCATTATMTVVVNSNVVPTFDNIAPICSGTSFALASTSNNGVTGTWSPAINTTATTNYVFTPAAGQCATTQSITVVVNPLVIPTFDIIAPICSGSNLTLPAFSTNGITGTWTPAVNNTATTTYTFIPATGQCAANNSGLTVEVIPVVLPTFNQVAPICVGDTFVLPTTSINGISGTWFPAVNTIATTTYTFLPTNAPCSPNATMTVEVNTSSVEMITGDSSDITENSATLAGRFSSRPCSTPTEYGIEYSGVNGFTPGFGIRVRANNVDTSNGRFSVNLTGLVQNTVYYYLAYSIDGGGLRTATTQKLFTTKPIQQGFTIYGNPIIRGTAARFSLSGIKPGNYLLRLYNIYGQLVYQKSMNTSLDFIDDNFIVPAHLPIGLYNVQIVNPFFKIQKNVMVQ